MKTAQRIVVFPTNIVETAINDYIDNDWQVISMVADPSTSKIVFLLEKDIPTSKHPGNL